MSSNSNVRLELFGANRTASRICGNDQVGIFVASTWAKYFAKYTPMSTGVGAGTLRDSFTIEPFKVIYNAPYAHYQWEGELYVSPTNGSSWAKAGEVKVPTGKPLEYSKEQNPLATNHWHIPAQRQFSDTVARQISAYIRRM